MKNSDNFIEGLDIYKKDKYVKYNYSKFYSYSIKQLFQFECITQKVQTKLV